MAVANNSASTRPKKAGGATGKGFLPGKSGNPSGRPKILAEVRELARQHGEAAFRHVVKLMGDADPRVSLAAAQEVLNRAYGKPAQSVTGEGGEGPVQIALIERVIVDPKN